MAAGSNSVGGAESRRSGIPFCASTRSQRARWRELPPARRRVVHLARDLVRRREPLGQQRLDLPLVEPVQPVHRLLQPQFILRGRDGVAEPVGEGGEVPLERHGIVVSCQLRRKAELLRRTTDDVTTYRLFTS